jgi:hypothetical protein
MKKSVVFRAALTLSAGLAWASSASAAESIDHPTQPALPTIISKLSKEECKQYGGITNTSLICDSKIQCETVDQHGQGHIVCISTIEKK